MFHPKPLHNKIVGHEARLNDTLFFFGTRDCPRTLLAELFPTLTFCYLQQVHGPKIVAANAAQIPEADGQICSDRGIALVIQTADCLPILMRRKDRIAAVHAGWRGLENGVLKAAAEHGPFDLAVIGPHIRAENFEVGRDVADRLLAVGPKDASLPHSNPEKRRIDLTKIARFQLQRAMPEVRLEVLPEDTFCSPLHHSFRRGKAAAERQYSFVALL